MSPLARVEGSDLGDTRLVRVTGEVDVSNVQEVMDAVGAAVPSDAVLAVVDLSGTTYLDSSGIAMLFRVAERLRFSRQEMMLVVPPDSPIRGVLELTNVPRVIPVLDSIEEWADLG